MADEAPTPAPSAAPPAPSPAAAPIAAPAPTVEAAPAAPSPAAGTAPEASSPPAAAVAPANEPAKVAVSEPAAGTIPEKPVSLLGDAGKPAPVDPAKQDAAPATPEAPVEPASEPPSPAPIEYAFTLPEGITLKPEELSQFTEVLGKHRAPPELGQELVNMHLAEVAKLQAQQADMWTRTRQTWRDEVMGAEDIGGNRMQTTLRTAGSVIEQFGTPELREVFNLTGAGDHPAMVRFLNRIGTALGEGKPVVAQKPVPQQTSKASRRYANSLNGAA